jgi:hypothetical protein
MIAPWTAMRRRSGNNAEARGDVPPGAAPLRAQMWSVLNHYPSSVTLSRSIFLSRQRAVCCYSFAASGLASRPDRGCDAGDRETMEKIQFLGAAVAFFAVGTGMILYEIARNRARRPILNGGNAIQLYYCGYLSSFVLGTVCVIAAIVK